MVLVPTPLPAFHPFHGDLFCRLSVPVNRIEVVFNTHKWYLPRQVAKDWKTLENALVLAMKNLLAFFEQNHPKTRLAFTSPKLPSISVLTNPRLLLALHFQSLSTRLPFTLAMSPSLSRSANWKRSSVLTTFLA